MGDKDFEKHVVAGARPYMKERLSTFEGKLWIGYEDHQRECDEAQRLGEARYKEAHRQMQSQLMSLMQWRAQLLAVIQDHRFRNLTHRTGLPASVDGWAITFEIGRRERVVSDNMLDKVFEKAMALLDDPDGESDE